jgi:tetratricopeptide (TPR) repeat protein
MMIQVCQGLTVAHAAGVFHRDLKPANLFVCNDRRIKILDFGVARLVGSNMTVTGNIIGTPDFMSPEQVRGEEIDGRSDIFSAGSVFYLLLTGRKPFAANDLPAVLNKVVRSQPLPIRESEAPEAIAAVIRKAMSKDPAARQQEVSELACELMAAASTVAATARRSVVGLRASCAEFDRLVERLGELSSALEIAHDSREDRWATLRAQYPALRHGSSLVYPLRSRLASELSQAVGSEVETLTAQVAQLEAAHARFSAGRLLQEKGDHEQALRDLDLARRAVPDSAVITRAVEASAAVLREAREREAHVQAQLALATEAADRGDWDEALKITRELERAAAGNVAVLRLREAAVRHVEAARADEGRPASSRKVAAAGGPTPRDPSLEDTTLGPVPPPHHPPSGPAASDGRAAKAAQLRQQAARHFAAGDLANAERVINEALALEPAVTEARQLLEQVRTALTVRARQEENGRRIADLLKRADKLAELKRFEKALALCDDALRIEPTHEGAVATRNRLAEERAGFDADREREAARRQRLRACAPALQQARKAFDEGDLERARWCAENALAMAPESPDAQELLAQITAAMPVPSDDDTVKLSDPASDDTAELAPLQESVPDRVRHQASSWIRQWRSADTKSKG